MRSESFDLLWDELGCWIKFYLYLLYITFLFLMSPIRSCLSVAWARCLVGPSCRRRVCGQPRCVTSALDRAVAPPVVLRARQGQCGDFLCRPFACQLLVGSESIRCVTGYLSIDKVKEYLIVSLHFKIPSVERLTVHMPGMNIVRYRAGADITKIAGSDFLKKTMVTKCFVANEFYEHGRSFTYCDFLIGWTWDAKSKSWHERGRDYYVHAMSGELYYLRMLLMIVKGAKSFEELRMYGGEMLMICTPS